MLPAPPGAVGPVKAPVPPPPEPPATPSNAGEFSCLRPALPPPAEVIVENTELEPLVSFVAEASGSPPTPPAPTVTVKFVPVSKVNSPVLKPPAPPAPPPHWAVAPPAAPPPPPTTRNRGGA